MAKTVLVTAAITATLHDGTNMVVLNEGKTATVAETSLPFLRQHNAIVEDEGQVQGESGESDTPVSLSGKTKSELLEIAETEGVEADDGMTNKEITEAIEKHRAQIGSDGSGQSDAPPA